MQSMLPLLKVKPYAHSLRFPWGKRLGEDDLFLQEAFRAGSL